MSKLKAAKDPSKGTGSSTTSTPTKSTPPLTSTGKRVIRKYTRADKEEFAAAFLVLGEVKSASEQVKIPQVTCHGWTKKIWWPNLLDNVRMHHQELIESKMGHIIELCTSGLVDRLQHGDVVLRGSNLMRVPVKAHEIAKIMGVTQDKLRVLQNRPTNLIATASIDMNAEVASLAKIGREYMYQLKIPEKDPKLLLKQENHDEYPDTEDREPSSTYED